MHRPQRIVQIFEHQNFILYTYLLMLYEMIQLKLALKCH